jgi:hypothetical protein
MSDQYIQLLLKYKNQVSIAACFIMGVLCFVGGRYSVDIPPKAVICSEEIKTADKLFTQIEQERIKHLSEIRECHDEEIKSCESRIVKELSRFEEKKPQLDCRIAKALKPQCVKRGLW